MCLLSHQIWELARYQNGLFSRACLIWIVSGLMRFRDVSDKGTESNFVQVSEKVRRRPWQWLDKRPEKKAWSVHGKSKLTETEKGETGGEQSQEHANFHWHKEIVQAVKQWIPHTTVTIYDNCLKMCEDFTPKFNVKRTGCCTMTEHILSFSPGQFWLKTTRLSSPTHRTFLCFSDWI
jgi:hypothetical protein